jgi:aminoglycoside phosphotransferase (APT) family kinase protein
VTIQDGFLTREQLVEEYGKRSGRNVENIDWYEVFAQYKLAVITEGIYARHLQGKTYGEGFEGMQRSAPRFVKMALEQAGRSSNPKLRGE